MEKKRILLTGMAGFIGFSLAESLVKEDQYEIVGLDNINDYYDVQLKFDRLFQLGFNQEEIEFGKPVTSSKYPHLTFIRLDLENLESLQTIFYGQTLRLCYSSGSTSRCKA